MVGIRPLAQLAHVAHRQQPATAIGRLGARQQRQHRANRNRVGVVALVQNSTVPAPNFSNRRAPRPGDAAMPSSAAAACYDICAQRLDDGQRRDAVQHPVLARRA